MWRFAGHPNQTQMSMVAVASCNFCGNEFGPDDLTVCDCNRRVCNACRKSFRFSPVYGRMCERCRVRVARGEKQLRKVRRLTVADAAVAAVFGIDKE